MSDIEKEIKKYLSEIKSNLICSGKQKRDIIKEIEGSVYEYAENKGIKDISEVYNHFGTPEEVARTHLSQIEPKKIKNAVNVRKVVIIGVLAVIFMLAVYLIASFIDGHKEANGTITEEISIVSSDTIDDKEYEQ